MSLRKRRRLFSRRGRVRRRKPHTHTHLRRLVFEPCESRLLLSGSPWQNAALSADANADGELSSADPILIVNDINQHGARKLTGSPEAGGSYYPDVNGDGWASALDVLLATRAVNAQALPSEGEYPGPPMISIANAAPNTEGSIPAAQFIVSLSHSVGYDITVDYKVIDGTAIQGVDMPVFDDTMTILAGTTEANVWIWSWDDNLVEATESYQVELSNPSSGTLATNLATGTILDNDIAWISIVGPNAKNEGDAGDFPKFEFTLTLSSAVDRAVDVNVYTSAGSASATTGDYQALIDTVEFVGNVGEVQKPKVTVVGDGVAEPLENFFLNIGAIVAGGRDVRIDPSTGGTAEAWILNDD